MRFHFSASFLLFWPLLCSEIYVPQLITDFQTIFILLCSWALVSHQKSWNIHNFCCFFHQVMFLDIWGRTKNEFLVYWVKTFNFASYSQNLQLTWSCVFNEILSKHLKIRNLRLKDFSAFEGMKTDLRACPRSFLCFFALIKNKELLLMNQAITWSKFLEGHLLKLDKVIFFVENSFADGKPEKGVNNSFFGHLSWFFQQCRCKLVSQKI